MVKKNCHKCDSKCFYFPNEDFLKDSYELDKNGVKRRNRKIYCKFDDHIITSWDKCKNYKIFQTNTMRDKIIVILGKSNSGKDKIFGILRDGFSFNPIISHTSRDKRQQEIEGKDYYFITNEEFEQKIENQEMVEYTKYTTANKYWYYGISKNEIKSKKRKICIVETEGLLSLINIFGKENIISFYIDTSDTIRKTRAIKRGGFNNIEWNNRLLSDNKKFTSEFITNNVSYVVNNDSLIDDTIENIVQILKDERLYKEE